MHKKQNVVLKSLPVVVNILISGSTDSSCLLLGVTSGNIAEVVFEKDSFQLRNTIFRRNHAHTRTDYLY